MCKDSRDACGTCGCVMFVKSVGLYIYVSLVSTYRCFIRERMVLGYVGVLCACLLVMSVDVSL